MGMHDDTRATVNRKGASMGMHGDTRAAETSGAEPTLLGVMTDQEVHDALLRRIEAIGPEDRRRLLTGLPDAKWELIVKLVFDDWLGKDHRSVYNTEEGVDLSAGQFHSGTTFKGMIRLDPGEQKELESAMASGYTPVFYLIPGAD